MGSCNSIINILKKKKTKKAKFNTLCQLGHNLAMRNGKHSQQWLKDTRVISTLPEKKFLKKANAWISSNSKLESMISFTFLS